MYDAIGLREVACQERRTDFDHSCVNKKEKRKSEIESQIQKFGKRILARDKRIRTNVPKRASG